MADHWQSRWDVNTALHYSYISSRQDVFADPSFKRFCVGGSLFPLSFNTVGCFEIVYSKAVNRKKQYLQNDYILFYGRPVLQTDPTSTLLHK